MTPPRKQMVPELLALAVEFHRAPLRFRHLTDRSQPLPDHFENWLTESSAALSPGNIETTAAALGLTPTALQETFLFFLRHTLLLPSADHYRVLGLSRECSADAIKHNYSVLVRLFHPDRLPADDERRSALTARINAAYHTLRDPASKALYDRSLPPFAHGPISTTERRDFFQPSDPIKQGARPRDQVHERSRRIKPLLLWMLGSAVVAAVVTLLLREPEEPAFRMQPGRAVTAPPSPAYLRELKDPTPLLGIKPTVPSSSPMEHAAAREKSRTPLPSVVDTVSVRARPPTRLPELDAAGSAPVADPDSGHGTPSPPLAAQANPSPSELPKAPTPPAPRQPYTATLIGPRPAPDPTHEPLRAPREPRAAVKPGERWPSSWTDNGARQAPEPRAPAPIVGGVDKVREPSVTSTSSRQSTDASRRTPPPKSEQRDGPGLKEAAGLISRLKTFYVNGDVHRLTGLFRADGVVNEGAGVAAIRRQFAAAFERDPHRRISIFDLRWSEGPDQRLLGEGRVRILGRKSAASEWHLDSGTIEFELVPWRGDYRVAKMIHHLSRK